MVVALMALGCLGASLAVAQEQTLVVDGSTTVGPIADAFAAYFMAKYPDLKITVNKTGSGNGAAALVDSRCDIAAMSRFMKDGEFKDAVAKGVMPVAHAIAMDGVCVIVHPSNPVSELTTAQIRDIYTGKIANWEDLGGPDAQIVAVSRDTSSGTYETFEGLVMNKEKMGSAVQYVTGSPEAYQVASTNLSAISYVGLGFVDAKVKALKIDGVLPTQRTIASGKYPVSRPLFLFTNGYPKLGSILHEFCAFFLSVRGHEIVKDKGFVPVTDY
jgi:phosphate transport system substrate-binding protein